MTSGGSWKINEKIETKKIYREIYPSMLWIYNFPLSLQYINETNEGYAIKMFYVQSSLFCILLLFKTRSEVIQKQQELNEMLTGREKFIYHIIITRTSLPFCVSTSLFYFFFFLKRKRKKETFGFLFTIKVCIGIKS